MIEFAFIGNVMAAGIGALVAIYVILAVILALGVYALIRLYILAKLTRDLGGKAMNCDSCEKLREKEHEIKQLEGKIRALEAKGAAPAAVIPVAERSLSDSLAAASASGRKGLITKKSIIAYLSGKYGDSVELNGRANRTPNGKLLLSDNHFAFAPDGKRVCFTYVYETDDGQVVSLIKLDEPYVQALLPAHPAVSRSAFPKNKAKDWYSVVADDTFDEAAYYAVLDHAIALIRGEETVLPEVSLSESLAAAKASGAAGLVTKQSIIKHLAETFGEKVELNNRANRTPNGKLLMSDNHFAFAPDGKRVCFTYIYQDDDGKVIILLRTTEEHAKDIHAKHPATGVRSAFPKNKEKDWYSMVVDDSFTEAGVYAEIDRAVRNIVGGVAAPMIDDTQEKSLKESLAAAKETGAVGLVSKQSIIKHLADTFGDKVELNNRANRTPNGKLLMSDNHFAFAPDGKRVCFTYIYEDDDGKVTILLRTTAEHAKDIRTAHAATGSHSAFPKNKERDWYSVVVDHSFTEAGVYAELDRAVCHIIGKAYEAPAIPESTEELSLKESIAAAKETGAVGLVSKQSIIKHLAETFGEKVELNNRANRTPNGKLLMSDNHFAFAPDGKRVCFTYIYEDEGNVTILLRTTEEHAKDIHAKHAATGIKSAFPKNKEKDWYSVVVDKTFTEAGVYAELDRAVANIIGTAYQAPAIPEASEEISLKESIAAAKETGAIGLVSKQSIIKHLAETFGEKVELNNRANRTPNGKLLMSDNHFAFTEDGKRVCFTYIYEDEGNVTILLRTTAEHAKDIHDKHPATGLRSAFPKNKEKDWYSVIVDKTFTEADVYAELDRAVSNILGTTHALENIEEGEELSLKESIAAAKETGAVGLVSKQSIIDHLSAAFGEKVELNNRANRTPNGKLLMSDNHFAFTEDGKRVCFTYIYEDEGNVTILLRTTAEHAKDIHENHPATGLRSAFPKNKEKDWYSVIVDKTFTEAGVYAELDRAVANILGSKAPSIVIEAPKAVAKQEAKQPRTEISLKDSLAQAKATGVVGLVSKGSIADHLGATFGDKVEFNRRPNRTPNGKLLLSDNHFAIAPDGTRECFTYIYEDDGKVTVLLCTTEAHAQEIRDNHPTTGIKSTFPKDNERYWYSMVVDKTFTETGVYSELDRAARLIVERKTPSVMVEAPKAAQEVAATIVDETKKLSLKDSLAQAQALGAVGVVSKKSIIEHLEATFGESVEITSRPNRSQNGKLLLSDNHFALAEDGTRLCFTYIYEDDGKVTILLCTTEEHAREIHAKHPRTGFKSTFPKDGERFWFSVVVDDSFTAEDVYAELDRAARAVIEK